MAAPVGLVSKNIKANVYHHLIVLYILLAEWQLTPNPLSTVLSLTQNTFKDHASAQMGIKEVIKLILVKEFARTVSGMLINKCVFSAKKELFHQTQRVSAGLAYRIAPFVLL